MALSYVGSTGVIKDNGTGQSLVSNVPAGVANGDLLLIAIISIGSSWTLTGGLSAWTPVAETVDGSGGANAIIRVYSKVASSEPASYTATVSSFARAAAMMVAYRGHDSATPVVEADANTATVTGTVVTSDNVTTSVNDCWLLTIAGCRVASAVAGTWTTGTGTDSERQDVSTSTGGTNASLAWWDSNGPLAMGTYSRTLTCSATFNQVSTIALAIQPQTTPIVSSGFMGWGVPV